MKPYNTRSVKYWTLDIYKFQETLLGAAVIEKHHERSYRLLNDLKNHGNQILQFSYKKTFVVDLVFKKRIIGQ